MRSFERHSPRQLALGTIFEVAREAGFDIPSDREKVPIRCPFHDDRSPSAVLFESNRFFCSACSLSLTAKEFSTKLQIAWRRSRVTREGVAASRSAMRTKHPPTVVFGPADAQAIWKLALERARMDTPHPDDGAVYAYLASRGLVQALETGCAGILPTRVKLPPLVAGWFYSGHRLIAPLFDCRGDLVNIQSRAIAPAERKTLFVKGSRASGTVFASPAGLELLRGTCHVDSRVLYGEGLTDSLAYAIACPFPALAAPGTSMYVAGIGQWARGRHVLLASDCDLAGEAVVLPAARAAFQQGAASVHRVTWPTGCRDAQDALVKLGPCDFTTRIEAATEVRCG